MRTKRVAALDIDLGRCTLVHAEKGVLAHNQDPMVAPIDFTGIDTLLIEVAGPVMHHAESHSHRRWLIYNAMAAAFLVSRTEPPMDALVCSSTLWTQGYSEIERDAIAGIHPTKYRKLKGKQYPVYAEPHDVRECRCMLYFYERKPELWVPLPEYLRSLCK